MSAPVTVYITRHGSEGNAHYGLFPDRRRPPLMDAKIVHAEDGSRTILYEPKEECYFNFCRRVQRLFHVRLPLGDSLIVEMRVVGIVGPYSEKGASMFEQLKAVKHVSDSVDTAVADHKSGKHKKPSTEHAAVVGLLNGLADNIEAMIDAPLEDRRKALAFTRASFDEMVSGTLGTK